VLDLPNAPCFHGRGRYRSGVDAAAPPPRYLGRVAGYVNSSAVAMDPLEAVTTAEQARQTADAHRRWQQDQSRAWGRARHEILAGVEHFKASGHPDKRTLNDLRAVERATARISARLGAAPG
jgi:hypothetical protein